MILLSSFVLMLQPLFPSVLASLCLCVSVVPLFFKGMNSRDRTGLSLAPASAVLSRRRRRREPHALGASARRQGLLRHGPASARSSRRCAAPSTWCPACSCSSGLHRRQARSDRFLDVSRIPADGLSEADCLFLLDHFFMANPDHDDPAVPALSRAVPAPRPWARTRPARRCAASANATCATCRSGSTSPGSIRWPCERDADLRELRRQGPATSPRTTSSLLLDKHLRDPARRSFRCTASWPSAARSS